MPVAIHREIGQLLIGSVPGRVVPPEVCALAREFQLGGVTIFSRNIEGPDQIEDLSAEVQRLGEDLPLWVAVDQEGGRVARLEHPFTIWPSMAALGRSGDIELAARFASALAAELRAVGISLDFAPVLDIHTNLANPVIGDRALAEDADSVARLGAALVRGLQAGGVAACGKHFPGHGDTSLDSHLDLPVVEQPPDRLRRVECVPFRAAVEAGVAFIMTAHVLVPTIDAERPATLSPSIVRAILREEIGYEGVILSDALEMKAISDRWPVPDAAVSAILAGCDGVLVCNGDIATQVEVIEALIHAVEDGRLPVGRVEDALARQRRAKERFLDKAVLTATHGWRGVVGCDQHRRLADEMASFL
jgi:beta-N-acetylhexosaminidase